MLLKFPSHVRWSKDITSDPKNNYSKNNQARLRSTLSKIDTAKISHSIDPLSIEHLVWFEPMYKEAILGKNNPNLYDLKATTTNSGNGREYFFLSLFENQQPIGGTIFSLREDSLAIAYRIYANKWNGHKLQANPALYSDFIISSHASKLGKKSLSHGKDRNAYGMNSNIGLATFKLSIGCVPSIKRDEKGFSVQELDARAIEKDTLIFSMPEKEDSRIKRATLFCRDSVEKYNQLLSYLQDFSYDIVTY